MVQLQKTQVAGVGSSGTHGLHESVPRGLFILGLLLWIGTVLWLHRPFPGDFVDDGQYIASSWSLAHRGELAYPSRPGEPGATKYPPGVALIATPVTWWMSDLVEPAKYRQGLKVPAIAAGVFCALAMFRFGKKLGFSSGVAAVLPFAFLFHPAVLQISVTLMSDLPGAALTCAVIWMWWTSCRERPLAAWQVIVITVLLSCAVLTRTAAVVLILPTLFVLFRRVSMQWLVIVAVVPVACAILTSHLLRPARPPPPGSDDYIAVFRAGHPDLGTSMRRAAANSVAITRSFAHQVAPPLNWTRPVSNFAAAHPVTVYVIACVTILLGVLGLFSVRDSRLAIGLGGLLSCHILLHLVWPWDYDLRFGISMMPLVYLMVYSGAVRCSQKLPAIRASRWVPLVFLSLTLLATIIPVAGILKRSLPENGGWGEPNFRERVETLRNALQSLPRNAVVASTFPEAVFMMSGLPGIPLIEDDDQLARAFGRVERLAAWAPRFPDRPLYLLFDIDPMHVSNRQAQALIRDARLRQEGEIREAGRFRLVQVSILAPPPSEPAGSSR